MKPMIVVTLAVGLAACAVPADSAASAPTAPTLRGRVIDGSRTSTPDGASLDVAIFWLHFGVNGRPVYAPMKVASVEGDVPVEFSGTIPDTPSADQLRPIHDLKTDFVPDPDAVYGMGMLYVTTGGALEENPEGVDSLDIGVVLGMARDTGLFFTSVDLENSEGVEPRLKIDDWPLAAGYHLFIAGDEVDLDTPIEAELGYIAT